MMFSMCYAKIVLSLTIPIRTSPELEEYRGHSRIHFSFLTGGHIHIMGTLYDSHKQELNFSNSIDQTELMEFAKSLYHDLCEV